MAPRQLRELRQSLGPEDQRTEHVVVAPVATQQRALPDVVQVAAQPDRQDVEVGAGLGPRLREARGERADRP